MCLDFPDPTLSLSSTSTQNISWSLSWASLSLPAFWMLSPRGCPELCLWLHTPSLGSLILYTGFSYHLCDNSLFCMSSSNHLLSPNSVSLLDILIYVGTSNLICSKLNSHFSPRTRKCKVSFRITCLPLTFSIKAKLFSAVCRNYDSLLSTEVHCFVELWFTTLYFSWRPPDPPAHPETFPLNFFLQQDSRRFFIIL